MGLPASQRRILEKIENTLRGTDPRLTSLFAIFSRLNRDEEMPRIEELRARASQLLARLRHRPGHRARHRPGSADRRPAGWSRRRAALLLPLTLVVMTSTFVVAAALPGPSRCAVAAAAADAAGHHARVKNCAGPLMGPVLLGK